MNEGQVLLAALLRSNGKNVSESGKVSAAELEWIEHDPPEKIQELGWKAIASTREAWAYALAKFLTDPVWFLMLFWLPSYIGVFEDRRVAA